MGEGESAITDKPFHIMKAVERIRPKLRIWAAACRGFWRAESMLGVEGLWGGRLLRVADANGVGWSCAQKRYSGVADARRILQRSTSECGGRIDKGRAAC